MLAFAADKFLMPNLTDAVDFMVTEAVEALQERLRLINSYTRNKPRQSSSYDLAVEVADTVIMACAVMDLLNMDLETVILAKLEKTDKKLGVDVEVTK